MAFVVDALITACWAFRGGDHREADLPLLAMAKEEAVVPEVWWWELRNILMVHERRGRITESEMAAFLRHLSRFRLRIDRAPEENSVLRLARNHGLSMFDAAYLELAQREGLPLVTLGADLRRAADREGVKSWSWPVTKPSQSSPSEPHFPRR